MVLSLADGRERAEALGGHAAAAPGAPGVPHGVRLVANGRPLEDAFSVASVLPAPGLSLAPAAASGLEAGPDALAYFGVFDGHGGAEAAQHAAAVLHRHFAALLARQALHSRSSESADSAASGGSAAASADAALLDAAASLRGAAAPEVEDESGGACALLGAAASLRGGAAAALLPKPSWATSLGAVAPLDDRYTAAVRCALRAAFDATDGELAGTEVGEVVGSTALVAVVGRAEVFVAHCGDSRAVLCRQGTAIPLTRDHKPDRPDERARVVGLGGKVVVKAGGARVMGLLAMSRALGDHFLRPYIIAEPEVMSLPRSHDDELLLLASDGLWDVFTPQEAASLALRSTLRARERGASAGAACRVGASVLARGAVERGSRDNITVCVVDLRRHEAASPAPGSVAAVLASQCSDASALGGRAGGARRKRTSCSGGCGPQGCGCAGYHAGDEAASGGGGGYAQHRTQTHLESLARTWAAASAAFGGQGGPSQRSSSTPGGGGGGGGGGPLPGGGDGAARASAPGAAMAAPAPRAPRAPAPAWPSELACMQSAPLVRGRGGGAAAAPLPAGRPAGPADGAAVAAGGVMSPRSSSLRSLSFADRPPLPPGAAHAGDGVPARAPRGSRD
ncbi:ABI1 [Scenedesmus sp. PABB004]|nr:ABI1 [Scenedesmus sp. PABB004]